MALQEAGFYAECDLMGRSVKAQMKYADKLGAKYSCIIGEKEMQEGKAIIKRMEDGETAELPLECGPLVEFLSAAFSPNP